MTLGGSYLLIPFWGYIIASVTKGLLRPADMLVEGFGVAAIGFIATVPYVAPLMYLGTWLWVRRIRLRLLPGGVATTQAVRR